VIKNKFKLVLSSVALFAVASTPNLLYAAALTWSADQTVNISSPNINLAILSGSEATSLVVNTGNISVAVASGDTFTVTSADRMLDVSGNTTSSVTNNCASTIATVSITGGPDGETITITPGSGQCSGSGSTVISSGSNVTHRSSSAAPSPLLSPSPAPSAPAATTYNFGTSVLKNGSTGEAVKELQRFLNATLHMGLAVDGMLGPKTIAIVKKWQSENGLVPDGLIGPATKAIMNAIAAGLTVTIPPIPTPTHSAPINTAYAFGTGTVILGTKGESCKAWQRFFNDTRGTALDADGLCGALTIAAAKSWQASVGLQADGILGALSRAKALAQ
jgi:peptidoglycan hydrolase-like protein with peptidoglycan-binding domain